MRLNERTQMHAHIHTYTHFPSVFARCHRNEQFPLLRPLIPLFPKKQHSQIKLPPSTANTLPKNTQLRHRFHRRNNDHAPIRARLRRALPHDARLHRLLPPPDGGRPRLLRRPASGPVRPPARRAARGGGVLRWSGPAGRGDGAADVFGGTCPRGLGGGVVVD